MIIGDLLGGAIYTHKGRLYGVECEVEGRGLPMGNIARMRVEQDGSLRGGLEYVFQGPETLTRSFAILRNLFKCFESREAELDYSFRTSTHVHVNVSDLEYKKVMNIIFLYTLVEDLFVNFCAEHRRGNRFALRFKEAQGLYNEFSSLLYAVTPEMQTRALNSIEQNLTKYGALNMFTLRKYGTLEFRSLEGTNDLEKIKTWMTAIDSLVDLATQFNSIEELHEAFLQQPGAFVNTIFQDPAFKFEGWRESVELSYSQAYHLVLISKGHF